MFLDPPFNGYQLELDSHKAQIMKLNDQIASQTQSITTLKEEKEEMRRRWNVEEEVKESEVKRLKEENEQLERKLSSLDDIVAKLKVHNLVSSRSINQSINQPINQSINQ